MAKLDEVNNPEAYKRALRGDVLPSAMQLWNALPVKKKLGYTGAALGLVIAAGAGINAELHSLNAADQNSSSQAAAGNEYCSTTDLPTSYEVPADVTPKLLSKDAATQAAGWAALLSDMKVPQGGSFGEVTLTVTDDGSLVESDVAQLDKVLNVELQSDGTLSTVLTHPDTAATAPSLLVTDATYCAPQPGVTQ